MLTELFQLILGHLRPLRSAVVGGAMAMLVSACGGVDGPPTTWVATWYAAQQHYNEAIPGAAAPQPIVISNQTIRQIVHTSYGGGQIRVKLSNLFGSSPVTFSAVHIARSNGSSTIDVTTDRVVTFGGISQVTVAPGTEQWSDAIGLAIPTHSDLAVSAFVVGVAQWATGHTLARQNNYIASGNQVSAAALNAASATTSYGWLNEVDVLSAENVKVVVTFGDSITDGYNSTVGANHRWPNFLDDRLQATPGGTAPVSIVNAGISGNRWLHQVIGPAGQARFSRDVMGVSGATHVVILLGINDIGFGVLAPDQAVTASQIIAAITEAVSQAKAQKMKVFLATLLPYEGAVYYNTDGEAKRQAVNAFIRSQPGVDGVIDFEKALQDPSNPLALFPAYDSGDHLHPNDAGYQVMANAVNLNLFSD